MNTLYQARSNRASLPHSWQHNAVLCAAFNKYGDDPASRVTDELALSFALVLQLRLTQLRKIWPEQRNDDDDEEDDGGLWNPWNFLTLDDATRVAKASWSGYTLIAASTPLCGFY